VSGGVNFMVCVFLNFYRCRKNRVNDPLGEALFWRTDLALSHIDPVWDPIGAGFTLTAGES
jgi:hypothetical protein